MDIRVGYASISVIRDLLDDYVRFHSKDGKYTGRTEYIVLLDRANKILNGTWLYNF